MSKPGGKSVRFIGWSRRTDWVCFFLLQPLCFCPGLHDLAFGASLHPTPGKLAIATAAILLTALLLFAIIRRLFKGLKGFGPWLAWLVGFTFWTLNVGLLLGIMLVSADRMVPQQSPASPRLHSPHSGPVDISRLESP